MYSQVKRLWNGLSENYKKYFIITGIVSAVVSGIQYLVNIATESSNNKPAVIMLLGLCAMAVMLLGSDKKRKELEEKRSEQLRYDYSEMITKLTLLISAGMTVRRAWERIVKDYQHNIAVNAGSRRYVYEEMVESYNQFQAGMSEVYIYESFGKRCNTREYLKFSSILTANLKKGSTDLLRLLELEAIDAYEARKNQAVRYGEQAGTKLMLPMIIMLAIVMAVIMLPAMMSFAV